MLTTLTLTVWEGTDDPMFHSGDMKMAKMTSWGLDLTISLLEQARIKLARLRSFNISPRPNGDRLLPCNLRELPTGCGYAAGGLPVSFRESRIWRVPFGQGQGRTLGPFQYIVVCREDEDLSRLLAPYNLTDSTDRAVAADWLMDLGMEAESMWVRDGHFTDMGLVLGAYDYGSSLILSPGESFEVSPFDMEVDGTVYSGAKGAV